MHVAHVHGSMYAWTGHEYVVYDHFQHDSADSVHDACMKTQKRYSRDWEAVLRFFFVCHGMCVACREAHRPCCMYRRVGVHCMQWISW